MSTDRREKAMQDVREAGYAMGGKTRPARGGPKHKPPMLPMAPPPPPPMAPPPMADPSMGAGAPAPGFSAGGTTGGRRAWVEKNMKREGFASGGSVQGRAKSAGKAPYGSDITPPAPGKDDDGDSSTNVNNSFKRGGKVR